MSIRIHGIAKTKAALKKVELDIEAASPAAVKAAGEHVARQMIDRAPRNTGRLASSIRLDVSSVGEGATAKVGAEVSYDRFVQKGTRFMSAQQYGEQAAAASGPGVVAAMAAVYKAAVE